MIAAMIVLFLLLVLAAGLGFYLANYAMGIRRQTLEEARRWQEAHYDLSWYDPLEKTDYAVAGEDGYLLHAQFLRNPKKTDRYVIISHGYTDNRYGSLKYAKAYLQLGFHVIVYDLRGHGMNEETFCTYSARERKDLLAIIRDSRERYPGMNMLGIHGESLGAATSVAVLAYRPEIDFVVADCGFSEIAPVLRGGIRAMHMPGFLVDIASLFAKIRFGYSYGEMRPIDSLKENRVPILFMHGAEDTFIPPEHSERMKAATGGYAEIHLIPGAGHAMSVLTDPEGYREKLEAFIEKVSRSGREDRE